MYVLCVYGVGDVCIVCGWCVYLCTREGVAQVGRMRVAVATAATFSVSPSLHVGAGAALRCDAMRCGAVRRDAGGRGLGAVSQPDSPGEPGELHPAREPIRSRRSARPVCCGWRHGCSPLPT